jgi:hypothetical protein
MKLQLLQRLVACDVARRIPGRPLRNAQSMGNGMRNGTRVHARSMVCGCQLTRLVFLPAIPERASCTGCCGSRCSKQCRTAANGRVLCCGLHQPPTLHTAVACGRLNTRCKAWPPGRTGPRVRTSAARLLDAAASAAHTLATTPAKLICISRGHNSPSCHRFAFCKPACGACAGYRGASLGRCCWEDLQHGVPGLRAEPAHARRHRGRRSDAPQQRTWQGPPACCAAGPGSAGASGQGEARAHGAGAAVLTPVLFSRHQMA